MSTVLSYMHTYALRLLSHLPTCLDVGTEDSSLSLYLEHGCGDLVSLSTVESSLARALIACKGNVRSF